MTHLSTALSISEATPSHRTRRWRHPALLAAALLAFAACGDSDSAPSLRIVTAFDASKGELPEGVVVDGDKAYVGLAPTGNIVRVDLATGAVSPFGSTPAPVAGMGFLTGLTLRGGQVYAALVSFNPSAQAGIYRLPAEGGPASLFASNPEMTFPNDLHFDGAGDLYISDSGKGSIFRVGATGGTAQEWVTDPALRGQQNACGPGTGAGFDIGINGIVVEDDAVYAVNLDQATLLRIPRQGGVAGAVTVVGAADCANLGGADGLVRDGDGFLVAVNRQNKIVRVDESGRSETVLDAGFDFPASLSRFGSKWIGTNFAFANAGAGRPASPALFELTAR
jgi:sugar lactone lactonase YvrE